MLTFFVFLLAGAATAGILTAHIRIGILEQHIDDLQRGLKPRGSLWQPTDYEDADYD